MCSCISRLTHLSHMQVHLETIPPHYIAIALIDFCASLKWGMYCFLVGWLGFFMWKLKHHRVLKSETLLNLYHQYKFVKP